MVSRAARGGKAILRSDEEFDRAAGELLKRLIEDKELLGAICFQLMRDYQNEAIAPSSVDAAGRA
jgi:hypothetical protein